jgi:hypothetical protein
VGRESYLGVDPILLALRAGNFDSMQLDDLVCEIALECGYRNYSPSDKGSSKQVCQSLKFIKFFEGTMSDMLQRSSLAVIPQRNFGDIAHIRVVMLLGDKVILPNVMVGFPSIEINIHDPDSVDIIRHWFETGDIQK